MKYEVGDIVLLNSGQTVYIVLVDMDKKTYHAISTDDEKKEYIVTDADIYDYAMHV